MTWIDANHAAISRINALGINIAAMPDLTGDTVTLLRYRDEDSFRFDGHVESFEWYKMVQSAMYRLLKKRGAWIEFVDVRLEDRLRRGNARPRPLAETKRARGSVR